jgi:hypothetical protein
MGIKWFPIGHDLTHYYVYVVSLQVSWDFSVANIKRRSRGGALMPKEVAHQAQVLRVHNWVSSTLLGFWFITGYLIPRCPPPESWSRQGRLSNSRTEGGERTASYR